jgi:cytochrome c oxidase subunit 3
MSATTHGNTPYYYVPGLSRHPAMAAFGLFFVILGAGQWINGVEWGKWSLAFGLAWWLVVLYQWFRDAVAESEGGLYSRKIDISYRWSMSWFIFSEVMFFGAFFTALWWARSHSVPALGNLENSLIWPDFQAIWPSVQAGATASPAGIVEPFQTVGPFWLPTINTALLLTSGLTLTIAHHALQDGNRTKTIAFMWITVLLGAIFLLVQGYEYYHAYTDLNLKLSSGIFGSTFFMLTGFHGFHVFVGMLMLLVITLRLQKGHFTKDRHFGFEGAAWYWHFVDVVWLFLYVLGVLDVDPRAQQPRGRRLRALSSFVDRRSGAGGPRPWGAPSVGGQTGGLDPAIQWLNKINRNSTMDKPMRTVNARAMRRERCASPLLESPFIMAANAAPSAPRCPRKRRRPNISWLELSNETRTDRAFAGGDPGGGWWALR